MSRLGSRLGHFPIASKLSPGSIGVVFGVSCASMTLVSMRVWHDTGKQGDALPGRATDTPRPC